MPVGMLARRIGLLGGSFNPAHSGHRHISLLALRRLGLDQVWWLVSPQNPLKSTSGMAPLAERMAVAAARARHGRIRVSDIERTLGTRYTVDTLSALVRRHPRVRFVWLMGADNLIQIARWRRWPEIFAIMPIAVFGRPSYSRRALASVAAHRFRRRRVRERHLRRLAAAPAPAWSFVQDRGDPSSATSIRARPGPRTG